MPLQVSPAPAPALRSVLAALGSPAARGVHTPALRSVQGPLSPELPLPVHVLDVRDAPSAAGSGSVRPTRAGVPRTRLAGWRFHIRSGDRPVAAADTLPTPDGGWSVSQFFEGPYLASTERALRQAESMATRYQPRLLSVPELYMLTLWLHGNAEADPAGGVPAPTDLLVPLAPAPPGIAPHLPYRVADLLPVMTLRLAPPPLLESTA
ncbi:hypothetical protein C6N75_06955 [Streptomyces solincola]|uniref:Uncharacterized protein n=1 Tax=Streptomyces solincola TaxID=2100817 RepID=A0A2S9PZT0_9ACTN|nr:hypothetical protein [Streptomyces solincola]PRH79898.1 hypothetical protein C6N75_06955 [Streptomyces solincola]